MTKHNRTIPRRSFLKTAGAAAGTAMSFPYVISSSSLAVPGRQGASDRLTIAHIGIGGMGSYHLKDMANRMKEGQVNIAAVCDCDEEHLKAASEVAGPQADTYRDYRYVLERKDIDAVLIATPDHWHGVQMVHACECGKHVYVEKPASCTIEEGKAMVAAAQKSGVSVQVGSQGRSQPELYLAHRYIANGMIGQIRRVTCWHYESPTDDDPVPDSDPPGELDYDLWLGPLRWRPYNKRFSHGNFRWSLESGGGQIRDRGAHVMSNAMYLMNADGTGPVTVETTGSSPNKGLWNSAIEMRVVYTFKDPDWELIWNQPGVPIPKEHHRIWQDRYGAVYEGDKDNLIIWGGDGGTWTQEKACKYQPPANGVDVYKSPGHKEDWFEGIKTGKKTIMNIEAAVGVANLTILGNLSFILGRKLVWDHAKQEIVGDEQARRMMSRPQRNPYHL